MKTIAERMNDVNFVNSLPTSRAQALKLGSSKYISKPCKQGHNSYRNTNSGQCSLCASLLTQKRIERVPKAELNKLRQKINNKWNASDKARKYKQEWKERDPKWSWVTSVVHSAKRRAIVKNIPFDISNEYILSIITDRCPIFDTEFKFIGNGVTKESSATLDRINPELGYVKGNIVVISLKANMIKSAYTAKDLYKVADWLYEIEKRGVVNAG